MNCLISFTYLDIFIDLIIYDQFDIFQSVARTAILVGMVGKTIQGVGGQLVEMTLHSLLALSQTSTFIVNIHMFTGCEVRTEKYFPEVSEAVRGRRPRDASEAEEKYFFSTDRPKR